MMKIYFESKGKFLVLLIAGCQLLTTFCSKQIYREPLFLNIESKNEKENLRDFMDAGTEKRISTNNTSANEMNK